MPVADGLGVLDDAVNQGVPDSVAPEGGADVQPLHLTALLVQLPQGDAAGGLSFPQGQVQAALRPAVFGLQVPDLIGIMLDIQVNLKLWVKVKKDWRDSDFLMKNFGYDSKEIDN